MGLAKIARSLSITDISSSTVTVQRIGKPGRSGARSPSPRPAHSVCELEDSHNTKRDSSDEASQKPDMSYFSRPQSSAVKIVKPPTNGDEAGVKIGQSSTSSATTTPRKGE